MSGNSSVLDAVRLTSMRNPVRMLIPAFAQVLLALAACSPGTETPGGLAPEAVTVTTGLLIVQVTGLPAGSDGAVVVSGPNGFSQAVTHTDTLTSLAAGTYTITASSIASSQMVYAPNPLVQSVSITAGSHPSKRVSYSIATGALQAVVNGLPTGTAAAITVTGPG